MGYSGNITASDTINIVRLYITTNTEHNNKNERQPEEIY